MNYYDYIKLSKEAKIDLLYEEGEHERSLERDKDLYKLFTFWVIALRNEGRDIISVYAYNNEPEIF